MEFTEGLCLMLDGWAAGLLSELAAAGWSFHACRDVGEAKSALEQRDYCVGLVALGPRESDLDSADELVQGYPLIEWIALVQPAFLDSEDGRELISRRFYDYHTAPLDIPRLVVTLGHARGIAVLKRRCLSPHRAAADGAMIGNSRPMQKLVATIRKVARADAPVMINGESGTGKELAARAVHQHSRRIAGPLIAVNCGALPPHLIQSELFGHEKGAFTGALAAKKGLIEAAVGGTIFLDEIGDLPLELQANLLRFLQEKTISRVGSTKSMAVDVRVIAATHVDLERAVALGRFREDLYYRLHVLHLHMPPLRERHGDVELLAHHFLEKFSHEQRTKPGGFTRRAMQAMQDYTWPGNVRELINRVRRALVMCEGGLIRPHDLGLEQAAREGRQGLGGARAVAERAAIQSSLLSAGHNISQAARNLGVSRVTLYRLLQKHALMSKVSG
jgi:DNA-binding NtrC family response regulator